MRLWLESIKKHALLAWSDFVNRDVSHGPATEAEHWALNYQIEPDDEASSELLMKYSDSRLRDLYDSRKVIEEKADSLFKFLTGLTGALVAWVKTGDGDVLRIAIAPLIFFALAIMSTLFARRPERWKIPVELKDLLNKKGKQSALELWIARSYYTCLKQGLPLLSRKSRFVNRAYWLSAFGVLSLILSWVALIVARR